MNEEGGTDAFRFSRYAFDGVLNRRLNFVGIRTGGGLRNPAAFSHATVTITNPGVWQTRDQPPSRRRRSRARSRTGVDRFPPLFHKAFACENDGVSPPVIPSVKRTRKPPERLKQVVFGNPCFLKPGTALTVTSAFLRSKPRFTARYYWEKSIRIISPEIFEICTDPG